MGINAFPVDLERLFRRRPMAYLYAVDLGGAVAGVEDAKGC